MTTSDSKILSKVVQHELALKVYIDALLDESQTEVATETATEVKPQTTVAEPKLEQPVAEVRPIRPEVVVQPVQETVTEVEQVQQQETEVSTASQVSEAKESKVAYPSWAEENFEALMFQVGGGLTLATPLVELSTILNWNDKITLVPGHAEWFLGLLQTRERQVKVIDIAKFVIPQNHKARESLEGERHFKHIIIVGDSEFGLACDDLGDVINIDRDKVRWRTDRSQRAWLAGTVIEQMCALLDVDVFTETLKDGCPTDEIKQ